MEYRYWATKIPLPFANSAQSEFQGCAIVVSVSSTGLQHKLRHVWYKSLKAPRPSMPTEQHDLNNLRLYTKPIICRQLWGCLIATSGSFEANQVLPVAHAWKHWNIWYQQLRISSIYLDFCKRNSVYSALRMENEWQRGSLKSQRRGPPAEFIAMEIR